MFRTQRHGGFAQGGFSQVRAMYKYHFVAKAVESGAPGRSHGSLLGGEWHVGGSDSMIFHDIPWSSIWWKSWGLIAWNYSVWYTIYIYMYVYTVFIYIYVFRYTMIMNLVYLLQSSIKPIVKCWLSSWPNFLAHTNVGMATQDAKGYMPQQIPKTACTVLSSKSLPVNCAVHSFVSPQSRIKKALFTCIYNWNIIYESSIHHQYNHINQHKTIPVVPHKAVAEVSKIGNL